MGGGPDHPAHIKVEDDDKPLGTSQATANMAIASEPFPSERAQLEEDLNFLRSNQKDMRDLGNTAIDSPAAREESVRLLKEAEERAKMGADQLRELLQVNVNGEPMPSEKVQLVRELKALWVDRDSLRLLNYAAALNETSWGDEEEEDEDYEFEEGDDEGVMQGYSDIEAEELNKEDIDEEMT